MKDRLEKARIWLKQYGEDYNKNWDKLLLGDSHVKFAEQEIKEYGDKLREALKQLKEIRALMSVNIVDAWNYHLDDTSESFIAEDIEVSNDNYGIGGDMSETETLKYNGWYEKLAELEDTLKI